MCRHQARSASDRPLLAAWFGKRSACLRSQTSILVGIRGRAPASKPPSILARGPNQGYVTLIADLAREINDV